MADEEARRLLDVAVVQEQLQRFADAREWGQFHSPKNLAMALAGESGELLEVFQWLTEAQSEALEGDGRARAAEELADIQIYLIRLADVLGISLGEAVSAKMLANEKRYPVEVSKGKATKRSHPGDR